MILAPPRPGLRAGLRRSALATIQHVEARQPPEVVAGPQDDARARWARLLPQRHVLEVGLIRGCASLAEVRVERFVARPRVVVVDLVIVPRHQPRHRGVQTLKVFGGLVLGVAVSVVRERPGLAPHMTAYVAGAPRSLVDVIADEHHQVEVLGRQVPMRAVEAVLEVLARTQAEPQPPGLSPAAGAVRVRPTGLTSPPAMNR